MGLDLYMVGVVVEDMQRAAAFYRLLGVDVPETGDGDVHVEIPMGSLRFFLNTRASNRRWDPTSKEAGYPIVLEFFLATAQAVDDKYAELVGHGYEGRTAPYDVSDTMRFALVNDPDGNTILLSGERPAGSAGDSVAAS